MTAKHILLLPLALLTLAGGCTKQESETPEQSAQAMDAPRPMMPAPAAFDQLPDVLAKVDDETLTKDEALQNVEIRLRAMGDSSQVDPGRLQQVRGQLLNHVVDQFIARKLLLDEAERRGIEVTEDDEQAAYDRIRAALPEGKSLEEVMQQSPLGEERMREEVTASIVVGKLREEVLADLEVTDAEIDAFTEANKDRLTVPENVHARHILLKTSPEDDEATRTAKKEKAEEIRKQLEDGADFAELAAEHSEGPSKDKGGDLGSFPRGRMVPPFEEAAFGQEVGVIGPIVETQFGYHIIEVLEHQDQHLAPREKVAEILMDQKAQRTFGNFINSLKPKADIQDFRTR